VSTLLEAAAYTAEGTRRRNAVRLPAEPFDGVVNEPVLHQAVKTFLANQRQGTAKTKTRGFVTGGNQKPWKQKGTGRARQGSIRSPLWPGGDTVVITNLEYRIPIAGPVTAAYFVDVGSSFITRTSQLQVAPQALDPISKEFPWFAPYLPKELKPASGTNFRPRASTGIEFQVILPVLNAPFRIYYAYNFMRLDDNVTSPQMAGWPPASMFPNQATYVDAVNLFQGFRLQERRTRLGFTVARTF